MITRSFPDLAFELSEDTPGPVTLKSGEQRDGGRHPLIWSGVIHHDFQSSTVRLPRATCLIRLPWTKASPR